jgi:hypothetical protein
MPGPAQGSANLMPLYERSVRGVANTKSTSNTANKVVPRCYGHESTRVKTIDLALLPTVVSPERSLSVEPRR